MRPSESGQSDEGDKGEESMKQIVSQKEYDQAFVTSKMRRKKEKKPNMPRDDPIIGKMNNLTRFLEIFLYPDLPW